MGFLDWFRGNDIQTLDLKRESVMQLDVSKIGMPKPPPIDVSLDSTWRYAKRSEVVFACIEKKATAATDAVLTVEKRGSDGEWEPVDTHPLITLLNKPNPYDDGESFIRTWIESENFADNFYAEIVRSGAGVPVQLYPLNPVYLVPQWFMGQRGWYLDHYLYFQSGIPVRLEVEDLLIRRRHGLGSIYSDVSQMAVALNSIDADTSATEYVRAFWNNGGAPSGVLAIAGRTLTTDEVKHIQQQWGATYARNGSNRNGVAVMPEGTTYTPVGSKLNELNNESLSDEAVSKICMIFGVPPILIGAIVGLKHVTQNATAQAAMGEFWAHTMSPELKSIRNFLTWNLLPMFEDIGAIQKGLIRVNWDMSQVDAMQEDIDLIHERVGDGYQKGIYTLNEARSKVGLPEVPPEMGGDEFFKPPQPVNDPNQTPPEPPKPPKAEPLVVDLSGNGHHLYNGKKNFEYQGIELSREPTLLEKSIDIKAIHDSYETGRESLAKVIQTMRGDLIKQAARAIRKFEDADIHALTLSPPSYAQRSITREVRNAINEGRMQVGSEWANSRKGMLKGLYVLGDQKVGLDEIIRSIVESAISRIVNEVASAAINIFTAARILGKTPAEIEDEIEVTLKERSDAPFDLIARQAINRAVNEGRREEMRDRSDDIRLYEYSAILDKNVCDPCEGWDGKQANSLDDLPETPNEECEGGANCRCFVIAIFEGEAQ